MNKSHQGVPEGRHEGADTSVKMRGAVGSGLRSNAEAQHAAGYAGGAPHAVSQLLLRAQLVVQRLIHHLYVYKVLCDEQHSSW